VQHDKVSKDILLENIVPFYQPIYVLENRRVDRYECLARLIEKNQVVSPDGFLYLVEGHRESSALTSRMLELSSVYCTPRQINWSVNLFASDLSNPSFLRNLKSRCSSSIKGLYGVEIKFECLENNLAILRELRKDIPNLHITVDEIHEFSESLLTLIKLGVNSVKIKAVAIKALSNSSEGCSQIQQLRETCNANACKLIAEHIEDEASLEVVLEQNILYGQGFYLSRPVPKVVALHSS